MNGEGLTIIADLDIMKKRYLIMSGAGFLVDMKPTFHTSLAYATHYTKKEAMENISTLNNTGFEANLVYTKGQV